MIKLFVFSSFLLSASCFAMTPGLRVDGKALSNQDRVKDLNALLKKIPGNENTEIPHSLCTPSFVFNIAVQKAPDDIAVGIFDELMNKNYIDVAYIASHFEKRKDVWSKEEFQVKKEYLEKFSK